MDEAPGDWLARLAHKADLRARAGLRRQLHPRGTGDQVIYDAEGYETLKKFLQEHGVRHVLLTGYATDMCFCKTTAGYENLSRDFNVVLVGDATLATFPANSTPRYATNAHISFAALNHLITQVSWIRFE